jgi:hypothetical protein
MKPNDLADAKRIAESLESGTTDRTDFVALLIYLRKGMNPGALLDIAHCVAHSDRDRGVAYTYIRKFTDHFLAVIKKGGRLKVGILFSLDSVISDLHSELNRVGISVSSAALSVQACLVENLLVSILEDVEIDLKHPKVASCRFESATIGGNAQLAFLIQFNQDLQGLIRMLASVRTAFPVFASHK